MMPTLPGMAWLRLDGGVAGGGVSTRGGGGEGGGTVAIGGAGSVPWGTTDVSILRRTTSGLRRCGLCFGGRWSAACVGDGAA